MEFRSKSCKDQSLRIESYSGGRVAPSSMQDLRSYSTNYASNSSAFDQNKVEKSKSKFSKASKSWSFNDPELQRKKRVAGYKVDRKSVV